MAKLHKMTPEEYFRKIIELYRQSRKPSFNNANIFRGRSASISSRVEDLTALFIALNNPEQCNYFVDQAIKSKGGPNKYPDIVILKKSGQIKHFLDIKTDMGWNRRGLLDLCKKWQHYLDSVKGQKISFKNGKFKDRIEGRISQKIKFHIVILSRINSGNNLEKDISQIQSDKNLKNIRIYVMSSGKHPNSHRFEQDELLKNNLCIDEKEFDKLMWNLIR
jgi:hypothetical protein